MSKGYTPYKADAGDPPNEQKKIKMFIKRNMSSMSDKELMKKVNSMSDGKTEYNWNKNTGKVESHEKTDQSDDRFRGNYDEVD